ncbi:5'-tyrosyl-DNA phosphodiesterase [Cladorrhinum sp. PSN259]|nr:5'-tyrosyl-DNA phosphodiesterase [Cladorrhinum sp. PSN259]
MDQHSTSTDQSESDLETQKTYQPYFGFQNGTWERVSPESGQHDDDGSDISPPKEFSILSWNIDFQREFAEPRMRAALNHVWSLISERKTDSSSIIMFEEMEVCDLEVIGEQEWVREGYWVTDIGKEFWKSPGYYGTVILVPKSLKIKAVFRVHYDNTEMQRDGLFVDIALPKSRTLRVCATHLESLAARMPKRPAQLSTAARYLHQADVGIIAGDFNAIQEFDRTLHSENNLKDAYLEMGGVEGDEEGMTWGHMAFKFQRAQFGLSRMDKILFRGGVELKGFRTFGMDVEVEGEDEKKEMMEEFKGQLEQPWVTDHLGVWGEFRLALDG